MAGAEARGYQLQQNGSLARFQPLLPMMKARCQGSQWHGCLIVFLPCRCGCHSPSDPAVHASRQRGMLPHRRCIAWLLRAVATCHLSLPVPHPVRMLPLAPLTTHTQDPDALTFRQLPTFEDCFPASEKHYREVDHNGTVLRVRPRSYCTSRPPLTCTAPPAVGKSMVHAHASSPVGQQRSAQQGPVCL